jgi:predicted metal-binding membrane protein
VSAASLLRLRLFPAAVLAGAVGAWAALAFASPPATGEAATFLVMWGLMVAAMMLPTILPLLGAHAALASGGTALVAAGYVLVWSGIGLVALVLSLLLGGRLTSLPPAVALAATGVYQVSPLKSTCLRRCRTPLSLVVRHWRPGAWGAVRIGVAHGLWCAGCCAALMVLLLAVGMMSLLWTAAIAALVVAEKTTGWGQRLALPSGISLLVAAALVAASWSPA